MVEVIHLRAKESPPTDRKFLLIEVVQNLQGTELIQHTLGMTIRVEPRELAGMVEDWKAKAEGTAMKAIYVRGAPNA